MMRKPVAHGRRHFGIPEYAGPFTEGKVGGDDDRGLFVKPAGASCRCRQPGRDFVPGRGILLRPSQRLTGGGLPDEGFEPPAFGLQNRCTTPVLIRHRRGKAYDRNRRQINRQTSGPAQFGVDGIFAGAGDVEQEQAAHDAHVLVEIDHGLELLHPRHGPIMVADDRRGQRI